MSQHPAITISRSMGSGGTEAGFLAARRLGWHFCDRRILRMAAEASGHSLDGLARQEEVPCGFLEHMLNVMGFGSPEAPYSPLLELPMYSKDLYQLERGLILRMLEHAPSVIVGRGGFVALARHPRVLHVSIDADPEVRVQSLVAGGKMPDPEAARRAVQASDRDRAAFIRAISGLDWHDPRHFHLVLDSSRLGLEGCVQAIVDEAGRRCVPA